MTAKSFLKWHQGNDVWALALISYQEQSPTPLPPELVALLEEFADVFAKPQGPQRVYDHAIPLLPNTVPVNSRPYRYSPLHKDEIERHVKDLLNAGLITHSKVHLPLLCYWCKKKRMAVGDSVWTTKN